MRNDSAKFPSRNRRFYNLYLQKVKFKGTNLVEASCLDDNLQKHSTKGKTKN